MAIISDVHESDENIFADLELPEAGPHFLKAQIVAEIYRLATERKLTQSRAGAVMGISQPEVSRLFKGNFREYSVDRLLGFLTAFGHDIEIISYSRAVGTSDAPQTRGTITFKACRVR